MALWRVKHGLEAICSKTKGASVVQPKHEGQFHCTWITPQQQTDQHPESPFPQHDRKFQSPWVLPPQPQGHPRQIVQSMTGNPMYHQCIKIETVVLGWHPRHQERHPRQPHSPKSPTSTVFWDAKTCSNQTHNMFRCSFLHKFLHRNIPRRLQCPYSLPSISST